MKAQCLTSSHRDQAAEATSTMCRRSCPHPPREEPPPQFAEHGSLAAKPQTAPPPLPTDAVSLRRLGKLIPEVTCGLTNFPTPPPPVGLLLWAIRFKQSMVSLELSMRPCTSLVVGPPGCRPPGRRRLPPLGSCPALVREPFRQRVSRIAARPSSGWQRVSGIVALGRCFG